jgi:hypothetical protein
MRKKTTRLRLEALEDRCLPSNWTGNAGDGKWSTAGNWDRDVPTSTEPGHFQSTLGAITVTYDGNGVGGSNPAGLQNDDSSLQLNLSVPLTVQGGAGATSNGCGNFSWNGGTIYPTATANGLTLNDIGGSDDHGGGSYWKGGTIGNSGLTSLASFTLTNGSVLTTGAALTTTTLNANLQVAGQQATDSTTLNITNTLNVAAASQFIVGTAANGNGVLSLQAATVTAGASNSAFTTVFGTFNVNNQGGTSTNSSMDFPMMVKIGGVTNVQSHNNLTLTGNSQSSSVVDVFGTFNLGDKNAGDTANGVSSMTCTTGGSSTGGATIESTTGVLGVWGVGNTWSDSVNGSNPTDLTVNGFLKLTGSTTGANPVYVRSTLEVTTGTVSFGALSTFSVEGDGRRLGQVDNHTVCDNLTTDHGSINVNATATLVLTEVMAQDTGMSWDILDTLGASTSISRRFASVLGWTQFMPAGNQNMTAQN